MLCYRHYAYCLIMFVYHCTTAEDRPSGCLELETQNSFSVWGIQGIPIEVRRMRRILILSLTESRRRYSLSHGFKNARFSVVWRSSRETVAVLTSDCAYVCLSVPVCVSFPPSVHLFVCLPACLSLTSCPLRSYSSHGCSDGYEIISWVLTIDMHWPTDQLYSRLTKSRWPSSIYIAESFSEQEMTS